MAPTTLVTFLVRTPPSTRSVQLYGSWDNFSAPYPMQKDARTGPEHWSGCHSFSNIICDGDVTGNSTPRQGGLKMGGTYWYYYTLDDEIEFHNSAEPSTTTCPMLPGQLINVLNVPFALSSSSRSRNDSVSSTNSEHRTMDPMDKFLNPRPVPTKPTLPRLKTSPTLSQLPWSSSSSPISATSLSSRRGRSASTRASSPPGSANILALVRPKPSSEVPSRSTSRSSNRSVGIIGGLRALASPLLMSPGVFTERGRTPTDGFKSPATRSRGTSARSVTPKRSVLGSTSPILEGSIISSGPARELALRKDFSELAESSAPVPTSSFAQHRRQKSTSREMSSLHSSQLSEMSSDLTTLGQSTVTYHPLETVKEVASATNTPVWPLTALKVDEEKTADDSQLLLDLEKRLPTLPNTPSSAYPPSIAEEAEELDKAQDVANLQSRFSCTTVDTEPRTDSYLQDNSRFSDWTDAPIKHSPESEYASSMLDFEPVSPPPDLSLDLLPDDEQHDDSRHGLLNTSKQDGLPSASSFSTVTSVASSAAPSTHDGLDSAKSGHFPWSKFQHYSLPTEEAGSGTTLKATSKSEQATPLVVENHLSEVYPPQSTGQREPTIPHSSSMQELLNELSYLGDIIQQH
ncbi:hypothetical protein H2200_000043 [Cladophialophora chaetospira]|uniref:Uncharacterized protein n=1 Tax=Cladophialophora chaetospira TaxID=386627 RepID=A0AA38XMN6_9EURO|nr:hypothetical protein H2200_000043 [Cladophialophora chaetospira]